MSPFEPRSERIRREKWERKIAKQRWPRAKRQQRLRRRREIHSRSVVVFGLFSPFDLALLGLALLWQRGEFLLVRYVLAWLVVTLAQPRPGSKKWSSRQAVISITVLMLPGFGSLMAFYWSTRRVRLQGAWQDLPTEQKAYHSPIDWGGMIDVVPMIDVLDSTDSQFKKQVLVKAQMMGHPVQTQVVRKGLEDPDPEVRYYAASLLSRVEAVHVDRVRRLEKQIENEPEQSTLWNHLAEEYKSIIEQDVVEQELRTFYLEKRLAALDQSLSLEPHQPRIGIERARTLLELGWVDEAESEANRWIAKVETFRNTGLVDLEQVDKVEPEANRLLANGNSLKDSALSVLVEVAFARNDQALLEMYMEQVQEADALPQHLQGLFSLWRSGEVDV